MGRLAPERVADGVVAGTLTAAAREHRIGRGERPRDRRRRVLDSLQPPAWSGVWACMRARGVHIDPSLVLLGGSPGRGVPLAGAQGAAAESSRPCECPRCGYDVTGDIPNWTHACPLHGRCSECGLEFEWGVLFSPAHHTPRWSFEHVREGVALALLKTGARTLWPGALWRTLRLEHPLAWRRLRWWSFILLAALYGACSLRNGLGFRSYVGVGGFGGISQSEFIASITFPSGRGARRSISTR